MDFIIKLFASICILVGIAFLIIFIISIVIFRDARKNSNVRMSFEQFRRIYNLSPNKWYHFDDSYVMGRKEYVKEAKTIEEDAKIALRNIRQEANNDIKKIEIPEDDIKKGQDSVQELINKYNKIAEEKLKTKEKELMEI